MTRKLEGKVAIVTGGARGVGWGVALALAREGGKIVVNDLGAEKNGTGLSRGPAEEAARQLQDLGFDAVANYESVADFRAASRIVQSALDHYGRLDILVNNAGNQRHNMIWEMSEEDWYSVINTHLNGTFNCTRHAVPHMMKQRSGRIINVFSTRAIWAHPGHCCYAAAKLGIVGFTYMVANELGPHGITVNVFSPGLTETRLSAETVRRYREDPASLPVQMRGRHTLGPIQPEEGGPFIAYLCTDAAKDINGQCFYNYGRYIGWLPPMRIERSLLKPEGMWTVEELEKAVPQGMRECMVNPAPPTV